MDGGSRSRIVASTADYVVLATRWNCTPIGIVATMAASVGEAGAGGVGAVLTRVDLNARALFSERDAEFYERLNRAYYVDRGHA